MEGAFEARKWGWRQTKEGIVVSFLVHPNDINAVLAIAPLGTIYAIGFREMPDGDTSGAGESRQASLSPDTRWGNPAQPSVSHEPTGRDIADTPTAVPPPEAEGQGRDIPRRPFHELPPTTQAVLACQDDRFIRWGACGNEEICIRWVRRMCGVKSRSELNTNHNAAFIWRALYARYRRETGLEAEPR